MVRLSQEKRGITHMGYWGGQLIAGRCEDAPCCGCGPEGCVQPGDAERAKNRTCYCTEGETCLSCQDRADAEDAMADDGDEEEQDEGDYEGPEDDGGWFGMESYSEE